MHPCVGWIALQPVIPRLLKLYEGVLDATATLAHQRSSVRRANARDLFKWIHRVVVLHQTPTIHDVFVEAVDCFTPSCKEADDRHHLADIIGAHLDVTAEQISYYMTQHKPQIAAMHDVAAVQSGLVHTPGDGAGQVGVGRGVLDVKRTTALTEQFALGPRAGLFAHTKHALRLMEQLTVAIRMCTCGGSLCVCVTAAYVRL